MRSWIRDASSILAILGGALFLVLPVAFYTGTASFAYPLPSSRCPPSTLCSIHPFRPSPERMVPFWASFGVIGILLGILCLKPSLKPRDGIALGLVFALGSVAVLFWEVTLQILGTFVTTPASYIMFPEASIVAMIVATILSYKFCLEAEK